MVRTSVPRMQWGKVTVIELCTCGKMWSDGSRFTIWMSDGRVWVWRMTGGRFVSDCIVPNAKFGGGSIMVWRCFSWYGRGPLVPAVGNMNSEIYVDILDNAALLTRWQYLGVRPFLFQLGNRSIHISSRS